MTTAVPPAVDHGPSLPTPGSATDPPVKLYVILADTAQLVPAMRALAEKKQATLLHQVTQCFTNASLYSLLTGEQLSSLEAHGTGYYRGRRYHRPLVDRDGVTRPGVVWPWRERNMLRVLRTAGVDIHVHNGSRETWWDLFIDHDPEVTHTSTMDAGGFDTREALERVLRPDPAWLAAEQEAIVWMQQERPSRSKVYFIVYHDMHSAALRERDKGVAYASLIERLGAWNWDEPHSIFWVWSDHGDYNEVQIDGRLRPPNWLTWAMFKDNTAAPIRPARRLISIRDLRPTLLRRFACGGPASPGSSDLEEPLDPDRIYIIEDSRLASDSENCDATAAAMFVDWHHGLPRFILQCTYDEKKRYGKLFQYFVTEFNDGRPIEARAVPSFFHDWRLRHLAFTTDPHLDLRTALQTRIDWVSRAEPVRAHRRPGRTEQVVHELAREVSTAKDELNRRVLRAGGRALRAFQRR